MEITLKLGILLIYFVLLHFTVDSGHILIVVLAIPYLFFKCNLFNLKYHGIHTKMNNTSGATWGEGLIILSRHLPIIASFFFISGTNHLHWNSCKQHVQYCCWIQKHFRDTFLCWRHNVMYCTYSSFSSLTSFKKFQQVYYLMTSQYNI